MPKQGFARLREELSSGLIKPCSPEITEMRLVPWPDLGAYDLYSSDARLLHEDLRRLEPGLMRPEADDTPASVDSMEADQNGPLMASGGMRR
jgi:hypothetical protein